MTAGVGCGNDEAECGNGCVERTGMTAGAEVGSGGVERTGITGKIDGDGDGDGAIIVRFNPMPARPSH